MLVPLGLDPKTKLGIFEIMGLLGMGEAYRERDTKQGRDDAIDENDVTWPVGRCSTCPQTSSIHPLPVSKLRYIFRGRPRRRLPDP